MFYFAVYSRVHRKVMMLVLDAADPTDPAYNPPNCYHIPIEVIPYRNVEAEEHQQRINSIIRRVELTEALK